MVLTRSQPHPTKSVLPSSLFGEPSKQNLKDQSQLIYMNSIEDDDAVTITNGPEKSMRTIERPRNLSRSNAFIVNGRQRRSKSTGGRPPSYNRPRLMSQEMTEL